MVGGSYAISNRETNRDTINLLIRTMQEGHLNCVIQGTLTANATSTIIVAPTCTPSSSINESPLTADAATARSAIWYTPVNGQFTVHHASSPNVDQTFNFTIIG